MKLYVVKTAYPWSALKTVDGSPLTFQMRSGPEMFMPVFTDEALAAKFADEADSSVLVVEGTSIVEKEMEGSNGQ